MKIPKKMGNEESKLVARIVNCEYDLAMANARLYAAMNRYKRFLKSKND